jgi:hypothetical protein
MDFEKFKKPENAFNVPISKDDLAVCDCGNEFFMQAMRVAIKRSPLVGEKPLIIPFEPIILCSECRSTLTENCKTKKDLKKPKLEV